MLCTTRIRGYVTAQSGSLLGRHGSVFALGTAAARALHRLQLGLQGFDVAVSRLQVLVQPVPLGNELRLPLPEAVLLQLDLRGEFAAN